MKTAVITLLAACSLALVGCAATDAGQRPAGTTVDVKAALQRIHSLYNKKAFETLYSLATERMRKRISKKQFLDVIQHVRNTLGPVRRSAIIEHNRLAGGKREIILKVRYDNGLGTERWLLRFSGNGMRWSQFLYHAPALTSNVWR